MAVTAPKSSLSSIANQAKLESFVKYDPEKSALSAMLRQAITERDAAINAAVATNRGMQSAIGAARPELKHSYGYADKAIAGTQATLDTKLSSLGAAGAPFEAAIAAERTGAGQRTVESEANALKDLSNRRIQSAASVGQARVGALSKFANDTNQIENRALDLAKEQGAFSQARTGELQKEQVDRAVKTQIANMQESGRNARSRSQIRLGRSRLAVQKAKGGANGISVSEQRQRGKLFAHAEDQIAKARTWINRLSKGKGAPGPDQLKGMLTTGQTLQLPGKDPSTGLPKTTTIKIPAFDTTFVDAALQLEQQGYLNPDTIHTLRAQKIHVPKEWQPVPVTAHMRRRRQQIASGLVNDALGGTQKIAGSIRLGP